MCAVVLLLVEVDKKAQLLLEIPSRIEVIQLIQFDLFMVPEAAIGDYVLVHVGVAINKVDEEEAKRTFDYLKSMGEVAELE